MLKIKEYIIENKQKVGIAILALAAAGGALYFLTKKPSPPATPQSPPALSQSNLSATSTAENNQTSQQEPQHDAQEQKEAKLNEVINTVRAALGRNGHRITPEVITVVLHGQYELANQEIKAAIFRSRRERRSKIDDHFQYAKIITGHQLQLESLQEKYLSMILARFYIDKVTWSEASCEWEKQTGEEGQGISDLIRQQEQKQLLSLRNKSIKPKSIEQILKVLQYKLQTLQSLIPEQLGFNLAADEAVRFEMIETYVSDLVHKEFGVQPEDLEYSIEQFSKEDKAKVIQFEDRIAELMDGLIQVDEEVEEGEEYGEHAQHGENGEGEGNVEGGSH